MNWKNAYAAPFHNDDGCEIYVKDSNNKIAFNKCERNPELYDRLLSKLNGFIDEKFNTERIGSYIYLDGRRILLIRGWGRLTGIGHNGLKLSVKEASNIQDEFGDWVVETLNR